MALPVYLDGVRWSSFDQSRSLSTSGKIGKLIPLEFYLMGFGDKFCGKNNHLMRFAPMLSPIFSEMRFDVDTIVVPLRILYPEGIDKFNLATNPEGWELPVTKLSSVIQEGITENLGDYFDMGLQIEEFTKVIQDLLKPIDRERPDFFTWTLDWEGFDQNSVVFNRKITYYSKILKRHHQYSFYDSLSEPEGGSVYLTTLLRALIINSYFKDNDTTYDDIPFFLEPYDPTRPNVPGQYAEEFLQKYPTIDSWMIENGFNSNSLYDYVVNELVKLSNKITSNNEMTDNTLTYAILGDATVPDWAVRAYNKAFIDYYANTQVIDPESWEEQHVLFDDGSSMANYHLLSRFYGDDYFTQCFPNSQIGEAVAIPADGTMIDLANASAWQRLKIRLGYTGKRIKDFAKNVYGTSIPDARLDRSELLSRVTYKVQVSDIAQTSQTTSSSELAGFSGRGISWGRSVKTRYFAPEPSVILVLGSVRPDTYYSVGLDPYFTVRNTTDFPIPDMENVGNHPVSKMILSGSVADQDLVYAWNRPFYPFIARNLNRVTGNMRSLYRYWTTARDIRNMVYNSDWLSVQDDESVNQIFTTKNVDHFYLHFHEWSTISRPLSRTIKFDI